MYSQVLRCVLMGVKGCTLLRCDPESNGHPWRHLAVWSDVSLFSGPSASSALALTLLRFVVCRRTAGPSQWRPNNWEPATGGWGFGLSMMHFFFYYSYFSFLFYWSDQDTLSFPKMWALVTPSVGEEKREKHPGCCSHTVKQTFGSHLEG